MSIKEVRLSNSFTAGPPPVNQQATSMHNEAAVPPLAESDKLSLRSLLETVPLLFDLTLFEFIFFHLSTDLSVRTIRAGIDYREVFRELVHKFLNLAASHSDEDNLAFRADLSTLSSKLQQKLQLVKDNHSAQVFEHLQIQFNDIRQKIELCLRIVENKSVLFLTIQEAEIIHGVADSLKARDNTLNFITFIQSYVSLDKETETTRQYLSSLEARCGARIEQLASNQQKISQVREKSWELRAKGVVPTELTAEKVVPLEKRDLWAEFVEERLVPAGFKLSEKSEACITRILQDHALQSGLTLYDAIGLALFKVLKRLNGTVSLREGFTLSQRINSCYAGIYCGMSRYEGQDNYGKVTSYTPTFFYEPKLFLTSIAQTLKFFQSAKFKSKDLKEYTLALQQLKEIQTLLEEIFASNYRFYLLFKSLDLFPILSEAKIDVAGFWEYFSLGVAGHLNRLGMSTEQFLGGKLGKIDLLFKQLSNDKHKRQVMVQVRQKLKELLLNITTRHELEIRIALEVMNGKLTQQQWGLRMKVKLGPAKPHLLFVEQRLQDLLFFQMLKVTVGPIVYMTYDQVSDVSSLHIENTIQRFVANLEAYEKRTGPRGLALPEIGAILYDLFDPALNVIGDKRAEVISGLNTSIISIITGEGLGTVLIVLSSASNDVEREYEKLLRSLKKFPKRALQAVKKHYESYSVQELLLVNRDEIKKGVFLEGATYLFDFFILQDILSITGKREFGEEEDLVPGPLAHALKLDGIDRVIDDLILDKTEKTAPLPPVAKESKPQVAETAVAPPAVKPKKVKTRRPAALLEVESPVTEPIEEELVGEEKLLEGRKVREVLEELKNLGFLEVRQTGSHKVLQHETSGGTVVVPNHSEIKRGTLHSIEKQAKAVLNSSFLE